MTEAISDFELGRIDSVVVGIGINYQTDDFPDELQARAGCIGRGSGIPRNWLVASILEEFWNIYENLTGREFMGEYRNAAAGGRQWRGILIITAD